MAFTRLFIIAAAFFLIFFTAVSCRKQGDETSPGAAAILSVKISQPYLSIGEVDSAFVIWRLDGQEQRTRLGISHDSLITTVDHFRKGNGQLLIHIYSNKKYRNQYNSEFVLRKALEIQRDISINFAGPSSFFDEAWFPRVDLKDAIGHRAIVALRPEDPYFEVKNPGHPTLEFAVDRGYWKTTGGVALAGRDVWRCTAACTDAPNEQFFTSLPGRIGARPWNHISIVVVFQVDEDGGGWLLELDQDI